jgi:hypothetical protein
MDSVQHRCIPFVSWSHENNLYINYKVLDNIYVINRMLSVFVLVLHTSK